MVELTEKDKELLDYLFDYCRYTTKQLSRVLNIPQQTVSYKIKRLEEKGFILRYDGILNWDVIPLIKKIYLLNVKSPEEIIEKTRNMDPVHSIHENVGNYNLGIWCFFKTKKQVKEFEKILPKGKYKSIEVEKTIFSDFVLFDTKIRLRKPKSEPKQIKIDAKDVKIIKHLSTGHARDSLLKISEDLKISYDIIHYRLRNLIKNGYFSRLMPQLGEKLGGLNVTLLVFEFEEIKEEFLEKIKNLNFMVMGGHSKKTIYLHLLSTNLKDYLEKLNSIHKIFKGEKYQAETLHWEKLHLANRYPLEFLT